MHRDFKKKPPQQRAARRPIELNATATAHIFSNLSEYKTVGEVMRAVRRTSGLSMQQIADQYAEGCERQQILNLEEDRTFPHWGTVKKWARAIGLNQEYTDRLQDFWEARRPALQPSAPKPMQYDLNRQRRMLQRALAQRMKDAGMDSRQLAEKIRGLALLGIDYPNIPEQSIDRILEGKLTPRSRGIDAIIRAMGFVSDDNTPDYERFFAGLAPHSPSSGRQI